MNARRMVVISDLHCGHHYGLTPPKWQTSSHERFQRPLWEWFERTATKIKPEILVVNGDAIEGKGAKNGGVELITTDRHEQGDMAVECLSKFGAKKIYMSFGTPYHTGPDENFERPLADKLDAEIENRLLLDVNGLWFDIRHHAPGSSTPYGPVASLQREKVMALLDERTRKGDVIVRSHVHKTFAVFDRQGAVFTTPCMQAHTEFGARRCSGDVDIGFMVFDIKNRKEWAWKIAGMDVEIVRKVATKV